jgi:hypothetical protein
MGGGKWCEAYGGGTSMEITLCVSPTSRPQQEFFELVEAGLKNRGVKVTIDHGGDPRAPVVGCWGWRRGMRLREKGCQVLVFERGYLGDRFHWSSIAWNGLNNRADFCIKEQPSMDKFNNHFELKPWNNTGQFIVIMGQVVGDMSLQGQNLTSFYEKTAYNLKKIHRLPVFFRPHPAGAATNRNFKPNIQNISGDLDHVLKLARLVVTYNSNTGVDAVINGIPALSFDKGSMAYEVTGHAVGDIVTPAREKWAAKLAHCQWSPDEIKEGLFWDRLKCKLES